MARKAADRTISFLDGKTDKERQDEVERIKLGLDLMAEEGGERSSPSIEDNSDRYRSQAFAGQEWVSKHFNDREAAANQYRVTTKSGMMYLEKLGYNQAGKGAYSYCGLMFDEEDLPTLARVVVDAAKAYIARSKK